MYHLDEGPLVAVGVVVSLCHLLPLMRRDRNKMSLVVIKPVFRVSDKDRAVQLQKMDRGLKFRI